MAEEGRPIAFTAQQLLKGIQSDSMKLRKGAGRVNEEGEYQASVADLERLTQNTRDELPRLKNLPSSGGGWAPDEYYQGPTNQHTPYGADLPAPAPSWDPKKMLPEQVLPTHRGPQEEQSLDPMMVALRKANQERGHRETQPEEGDAAPDSGTNYDAASLMDKLAMIKQQAQLQGKHVQMNIANSQRAEYYAVFREVMKTMSDTTGMTIDMQGGARILCYWTSDTGKFTGFNRIYTDSGTHLGLALVDNDDINVEDTLAQVAYGDSLEEFQSNAEDFFCNLYTKHLGLEG